MQGEDRLTIGVVCSRGVGPERGGRPRNEDNYLVCRQNEARYRNGEVEAVEPVQCYGTLVAVADGMGGHEDGDLASSAAVRAMARIFKRGLPDDPQTALHKFVMDAHRRLHAKLTLEGGGAAGAWRSGGNTCSVVCVPVLAKPTPSTK